MQIFIFNLYFKSSCPMAYII